jgi:hypothetical protein
MDQIDVRNPLVLGAIGVAMFFVGQLLFKGDSAIENRRRVATRLAGRLRELGFTRLPPILEDYAVGDYSGMISKIREVADLLGDERERQSEFERVFQLVLEAKMRDPEKREALLKTVDRLRAVHERPPVVGGMLPPVVAVAPGTVSPVPPSA